MQISTSVQAAIERKLSERYCIGRQLQFTSVGGGSINETYRISFGDTSVFCKINSAARLPQLFQKEKEGLHLIAEQNIINTPAVIDCFEQDDIQILLLQWIQHGQTTESFWQTFGEGLAALHRVPSLSFGLDQDNYMGSVPQSNHQHKTWINFFREERLQSTTKRCFEKCLLSKKHLNQFEALQNKLSEIFEEEKPSLLHGDLWSGNFMCNEASEPVLIDPAVYYGHRSMDLAMTTLFGSFPRSFYEAYHHHYPFPKNYEEQWAACNLYPLLIHLYLFGSSYLSQIEQTLRRFA